MGLQGIIKKVCSQTAVYWGAPTDSGQGDVSWAAPVELKVRWDGVTKLIKDSKGKEIACRAEVLVAGRIEDDGVVTVVDLDVDGRLYLGFLHDLDSAQKANPLLVDEAWPIMRFDSVPEFASTTKFVKSAYL